MSKVVSKYDCYESIQWTGNNLEEVIEFTGKHPDFDKWFKSFEEYEEHVKEDGYIFKLYTDVGTYRVEVGDYLLKSEFRKVFAVSEVHFKRTYLKINQESL